MCHSSLLGECDEPCISSLTLPAGYSLKCRTHCNLSITSILMALVRPPPHDPSSPSAKRISTDNAEELMLLETPEKERPHQLPPPHSGIMLKSARLVLVLILALSYLTFCFIVHYRNVPVGGSEVLGPPSLHCEQYLL